jgi:hypothetical protein
MLSCMRRSLTVLCLMGIISFFIQGWIMWTIYDFTQVCHFQWWGSIHNFLWDYQHHRLRHWNWVALDKSKPRSFECRFLPLVYLDCCATIYLLLNWLASMSWWISYHWFYTWMPRSFVPCSWGQDVTLMWFTHIIVHYHISQTPYIPSSYKVSDIMSLYICLTP